MKSPKEAANSYMELCFHVDGRSNIYLRVPTLWDAVENQWIGFIQTPITRRLISGKGKDSFELQNSFNTEISKFLSDPETHDEVSSMFKPKEYWEARE